MPTQATQCDKVISHQHEVQFDGAKSEPFSICSGVNQGCVLAPTLFGLFFVVMLRYTFATSTEGVFLCMRSDERLFNLSRQRAKTKVQQMVCYLEHAFC